MLLSVFFSFFFYPSDGPKNSGKRERKGKPGKLFSLEQSYIDCLAGVLGLEH